MTNLPPLALFPDNHLKSQSSFGFSCHSPLQSPTNISKSPASIGRAQMTGFELIAGKAGPFTDGKSPPRLRALASSIGLAAYRGITPLYIDNKGGIPVL